MNHLKHLIICLAIWGLTTVGVRAEKGPSSTWMATYYVTQDLSGFDRFWANTVGKGAFEASTQVKETTIGFLGALLHQHPELMKGRLESVEEFPEKQRDAAKVLLWLINTDVSRELLKKSDPEMVKRLPPSINKRMVYRTGDIDFCVGWFCATGDTAALRPLLEAIKTSSWSSDDARPDYAVVNLQDICRRDPQIKTFIQSFLESEQLNENARTAIQFILQTETKSQTKDVKAG